MPKSSPLARAESALRKHALAYPEAYEEFPWGHRAIKVKGKIFVALAMFDGVFSVSLKLPLSNHSALNLPFTSPTEYGLGKSGWVTARFGPTDDVPVEMLEEWIDESYRAIAPKRVQAMLEKGATPAKEKPPTKKRRKKQGK